MADLADSLAAAESALDSATVALGGVLAENERLKAEAARLEAAAPSPEHLAALDRIRAKAANLLERAKGQAPAPATPPSSPPAPGQPTPPPLVPIQS